jgi:hypothetical protein
MLLSRTAAAFYVPDTFHTPPNAVSEGSGGVWGPNGTSPSLYFTGSQRFVLHHCGACHTTTPGVVGIQISATDATKGQAADLLSSYTPGDLYVIEVKMVNETLGHKWDTAGNDNSMCDLGAPMPGVTPKTCNANEFALDVTRASDGAPIGGLASNGTSVGGALCSSGDDPKLLQAVPACSAAPFSVSCTPGQAGCSCTSGAQCDPVTTDVNAGDPTAVISLEWENDPTDWKFAFIAPPAGTGPIVFSLGAVDGNGGDGTGHDVNNDDVALVQEVSVEQGMAMPTLQAGCSTAPRAPSRSALAWLMGVVALTGVAVGIARRARRRS